MNVLVSVVENLGVYPYAHPTLFYAYILKYIVELVIVDLTLKTTNQPISTGFQENVIILFPEIFILFVIREPYYIFFKKMQKIINIFKQNGEATRKSLRLILKLVATSQIAHIGVN